MSPYEVSFPVGVTTVTPLNWSIGRRPEARGYLDHPPAAIRFLSELDPCWLLGVGLLGEWWGLLRFYLGRTFRADERSRPRPRSTPTIITMAGIGKTEPEAMPSNPNQTMKPSATTRRCRSRPRDHRLRGRRQRVEDGAAGGHQGARALVFATSIPACPKAPTLSPGL
jgi:hypothetical protein